MRASNRDIGEAFMQMLDRVKPYVLNKSVYLLAHNGGKFDIKIIMNAITLLTSEGTITNEGLVIDSSQDLYQLRVGYADITFNLRDSYKLISSSVANIAKLYLKEDVIGKMRVDHALLNAKLALGGISIDK